MIFNKSHFIDIDLLQKYDKLLADKELYLMRDPNSKTSILQVESYQNGAPVSTNISQAGVTGAIIFGQHNIAVSSNQFLLGRYNKESSLALFAIGNGDSEATRKNLFEVTSDNKIIILGSTIIEDTDNNSEWILDGGDSEL